MSSSTSISIDALLEYFIWMIIVYILPSFVSAGLITTVMNSTRSRIMFEHLIEIMRDKFNDGVIILEGSRGKTK